jgi:predicted alpha/beta-hydrolase family hydrolase
MGYVFAHGAGAGMRHTFMEQMTNRLAARGVATLRYQFPYTEARRSRPDARAVLVETVRAAVREAAVAWPDMPLFAGGKSMGGRMTSHAAAEGVVPEVRGIVFLGFPLHPAGRRDSERADHLALVRVPMLFLQGTRDDLADLELLRPVCNRLRALATLHVIEGADHGFHVLRRSGRSDDEVLDELADTMARWMAHRAA